MAEDHVKQSLDEISAKRLEEWWKTPEGAEAKRKTEEQWKKRQNELWREDCKEDGVIHRHPSTENSEPR